MRAGQFRHALIPAALTLLLGLRLDAQPIVSSPPTNQVVAAGNAALFSVTVSGPGPFAYQWQFNGTNLPNGVITTVAGNGFASYAGDGGAAIAAELNGPIRVSLDPAGDLLIADFDNHRIRKVGAAGIITTVAGNGTPGYSGDSGPATNSVLYYPADVAADSLGNVFIADQYNHRVRKVGTNGTITTVAGNGTGGYAGDGAAATNAELFYPAGLALDATGNLFIADYGNQRVRKVATNGVISTVAGNGTNGYSGDGSAATNCEFSGILGLAVDASGNLFIADYYNNRICQVDDHGILTTVAGNGISGYLGDNGAATNAELYYPESVALDSYHNLFIADEGNNRVRVLGTNGIITTVAGSGTYGFTADGGPATNAELEYPTGVAVGSSGNLFLTDYYNQRVRQVIFQNPRLKLYNVTATNAGAYDVVVSSPYGSVTSSVATLQVLLPPAIVGQPPSQAVAIGSIVTFSVATTGSAPLFFQWYFGGVTLVGQTNSTLLLNEVGSTNTGSYYVTITNQYGSVTSAVAVLTAAILPVITTQPASRTNLFNTSASFSVTATGSGPLSYQWQFNGTNIPSSTITSVAGNGVEGFAGDGGPAAGAELNYPSGVAVDSSGNLFIADYDNSRIRKVGTNGIITTLAGNGTWGYSGDGGPATNAELYNPNGVTVDAFGNVFIADTSNYRVRKVGTNGMITTVAGNGTFGYSGDGGAATSAELSIPESVAVDASGNLYIEDGAYNRVRKVATNGIITTVAGNGVRGYSGDNGPATAAELYGPGIAVDAIGNLFLADGDNERLRKVGTNGIITTVAGTGAPGFSGDNGPATSATLYSPEGLAVDAAGNIFIADYYNNRIRKVQTNGVIITVAGSAATGHFGDGGIATDAALYNPNGVAVDASGNLFIADDSNHRIRKVIFQGSPLVLTNVSGANAGTYDVVVSNQYGCVTSAVATLQVLLPPTVATQPQGEGLAVGGNATLTVSATGTAPLHYQWDFDGTPLSGQTNATFQLTGAALTNSGSYTVVVTNQYGSATSVVAVVIVGIPPGITAQPVNQINLFNTTATFTVGASGTAPLNYQWQFNGTNLPTNIITTVAGNGTPGYFGDGGRASLAELAYPPAVAVDAPGNLLIADVNNNRIRKIGTNGVITTVAGISTGGYSGDAGSATNAKLANPNDVAVDAFGNLFIADEENQRIRKVGTNGIITTVAGNGTAGYAGDNGVATNAALYFPEGIAVDTAGNLFIADQTNRIRRVGTNGIITTVAGNGSKGYGGDGGAATAGELNEPNGVTVDASGNIFIADTFNQRVRKVGTNGIITTVAGNGTQGYAGDNGAATNAELNNPQRVVVDAIGNLFIADYGNQRIRKLGANGIITTVAGNGTAGYAGDGGAATNAALKYPIGVAVDSSGNLFIADSDNSTIRKVIFQAQGPVLILNNVSGSNSGPYDVVVSNPGGSITSSVVTLYVLLPPTIVTQPQGGPVATGSNASLNVAATGTAPFSYQWNFDGTPLPGQTNATLLLTGTTFGNAGSYSVVVTNLYGTATSAMAVVTVGIPPNLTTQPSSLTNLFNTTASFSVAVAGTGPFSYQWQCNGTNLPNGVITTVAGIGQSGYFGDNSPATNAELNYPTGVALDVSGNLLVVDRSNQRIRKVGTGGLITTVAGNGTPDYAGDGATATNAELSSPIGVTADAFGDFFIADYSNQRIRKVATNGLITTVAGNGTNGYSGDGGAATNAELNYPFGAAVDVSGNLFIADYANQRVRKVGSNGIITTLAGNGTNGFSGDGGAATNAELASPQGVAVDLSGNVFIADSGNQRIRKVGINGTISTVAGSGTNGYFGDGGPATNAAISNPVGLAVDPFGNLFIADYSNQRVREVGTNGIISTVAGNGLYGYAGDGGPATNAEFEYPEGVAVDASGNLFIADYSNQRVRKSVLPGPTLLLYGVTGGNAGIYDVVVSNPYGTVTSSVVTLQVLLPPTITLPPNQWIALGSNATISPAVAGTAPFYYTWNFNGASLPGQTNAALLLSGVAYTNAGSYNLVVTNMYGSATSGVAVVTVGIAPGIAAQPVNQTVQFYGTATFSAVISGTGPLSYQWQFNGANLPNGVITTAAGNGKLSYSGDGGPATNAALLLPSGLAIDALGNLIIADSNNSRVRKVGTNGVITTVAGNGTFGSSGDTGQATNAELGAPIGLALDTSGNLFITDWISRVRKVGTNGIITTVAGNGTNGYLGDGGLAVNAELNRPGGVVLDAAGNLFIADWLDNRIRKVGTNGIITTFAGGGSGGLGDGGAATNAGLSSPTGVAMDAAGNLYIADSSDQLIRRVDTNGIITTVAGNRIPGYSGDGVAATSTSLNTPYGVAVDAFGNLFIADAMSQRIRKVDTTGIITTVAGNGAEGYAGDNGLATNAELFLTYQDYPSSMVADASGNLFIADEGNCRIRKVSFNGPTLVLNAVNGANAGSYDLVVSNLYGSVTSSVVTLQLAQAPALVTPPQSQVVAAGTTVTMGVAVSGSSPLTYQWLFNGEAINDGSQIAGSQSNLLTLDNVTLGNSGNYQLVVTNAYGSTNASATLTVLRKTPLITWSNPTPITYGAPLTPAQLNATAMVPGAFAYNPATGTVLNAGTTTLSLLFTPADTVDYSGSIDTVSMVVLPEPLTVSANNAVRAYGQPNPALTGVITGLANGDNITATYSVTANPGSPVGKYPILPSLVDPNNRQINYAVSLVNGTLTVATPPAILSASQFGNSFVFTWSTTAFQTYQIQYATNLNQGTWVNLGEAITATNSTATASGSTANAQEFYRVVVLP